MKLLTFPFAVRFPRRDESNNVNRPLSRLVLPALLLLASVCLPPGADAQPSVSKPAPLPTLSPEEQHLWLLDHVIAASPNGLAIDPYDYLRGQTHELQVPSDEGKGQELFDHLPRALKKMSNPGVPHPLIFRDYVVRHMLEKAEEESVRHHKRIVIFAHGGLNFLKQAIQRAASEGPIAERDCYPIFICWDSSFSTSYVEHLTSIRNGVDRGGDASGWAWLTAPVYLATDLATSVVRTPRILVDLGRSNLKGWSFPQVHNDRNFGDVQDAMVRYYALRKASGEELNDQERREEGIYRKKLGDFVPHGEHAVSKIDRAAESLTAEWKSIHRQPGEPPGPHLFPRTSPKEWAPIPVSKGSYEPELGDSLKRIVTGWTGAPVKVLVLAILAGAGTDMWDVMSRRTQVMYHYEGSFRPNWGSAKPHASYRETNSDVWNSESTGIGCMAVFLRKLQEEQTKHHCKSVSLIGHSMGAMVFDEGLREFPGIQYQDIVYLAAACSIRDFNDTAIRYLERRDHQQTQFYALCLHPRAEDRDISFWEAVPRGSLLVWIDEFLGHPQSFTDRRLGHFENALLASRLFPPRLQKRLHFTALSTGPAAKEYDEHGQFSSLIFWNPKSYTEPGYVNRRGNPDMNIDLHKAEYDDNARRYLPK